MWKFFKPKTITFESIEARHGGAKKGNRLTVCTGTGIIALTRMQSRGFMVENRPLEIIGRHILGPLAAGDMQLGRGERILKITKGPTGYSVFYKFMEISRHEKKAAMRELACK
ncbi:MAG: hypothetical protein WCY41_05625 [Candidatus Micrarchaeia archaeon]